MKTFGSKTIRLVVWTVTGSITLSSCTCGDLNVVEEIVNDKEDSYRSCAIRISMTEEQVKHLNELAELSNRILMDREFAKEFSSNPRKFVPKKSSPTNECGIENDEALMKVVNALSDDEIAEAINNNDIKQYLLLMYRKGYLDDSAKINDYSNLMTIEEKRKLLKSIGFKSISDKDIELCAVALAVFVFYAAVVAVSWVGVAYTVAAAINMAAAATVVAYSAAAVKTKVTTSSCVENIQLSSNFDVYMLSASEENLKILFSDENINKMVNDAVDAYSEIFKEDAKKLDLERFRQTINLNISKQQNMSSNIMFY